MKSLMLVAILASSVSAYAGGIGFVPGATSAKERKIPNYCTGDGVGESYQIRSERLNVTGEEFLNANLNLSIYDLYSEDRTESPSHLKIYEMRNPYIEIDFYACDDASTVLIRLETNGILFGSDKKYKSILMLDITGSLYGDKLTLRSDSEDLTVIFDLSQLTIKKAFSDPIFPVEVTLKGYSFKKSKVRLVPGFYTLATK